MILVSGCELHSQNGTGVGSEQSSSISQAQQIMRMHSPTLSVPSRQHRTSATS